MNDTEPLVTGQRAPATASILVIDDQLLMSSALARTLRGLGLDAHSIRAEVAEIEAATLAHLPGLVLLDLDLGSAPDGQPFDGVALIAPLCARGWTVLLLTEKANLDQIARALALGATSWIDKVSSVVDLVHAVVEMMAGHGQATTTGRRWNQPMPAPVRVGGERTPLSVVDDRLRT